jgi:hypothetical protein
MLMCTGTFDSVNVLLTVVAPIGDGAIIGEQAL